jgi:hypothetical protein
MPPVRRAPSFHAATVQRRALHYPVVAPSSHAAAGGRVLYVGIVLRAGPME